MMRYRTLALSLTLLAGCAPSLRVPFSPEDIVRASPLTRFGDDVVSADRFARELATADAATRDEAFDLIALSGGGAEGAFGAGLVTEWGRRGDRPTFEVVTGVSIGALMAPFVFIGEAGDADLTAAFIDGRSSHVLQARWLMALRGPGLFRSEPLRRLVESAITPEVLEAVAESHDQGRRLYVATTSLDTQTQVIWDMGALAASGRADARARFIDILVASSSIPGVFPPVFLNLAEGGGGVRELHADGRTTANFFVAPEGLMLARDVFAAAPPRPRRLWVLLNGRPRPAFSVAANSHVSVAGRGLDAMMKASTRTNLIATRRFADANGMDFSVAMAPAAAETSLDFSVDHMRALFTAGADQAASGRAWSSEGD